MGIVAERLIVRRLLGIEALYSTYNRGDERDIFALASKYDLFISGGSDFHGANKANIDLGSGMGRLFVPEEYFFSMKEYSQKHYPI